MVFEGLVDTLGDLRDWIRPDHQTMTYYGFARPVLQEFVEGLADRAIARVVPIGQALQFEGVWDGYSLLGELTRRVTVR